MQRRARAQRSKLNTLRSSSPLHLCRDTRHLRMNSLTFALILALLCTLSHYSSATSASNISDKCCTEFTHKVIPKKMIVSYQKTNSNCPKDGVIFKTLKRGEVCVDPAVKWVKACMEHLDSQTTVKPQTAAKL